MDRRIGNFLATCRLIVGAGAWLTPNVTSALSSLGSEPDWKEIYLWRIFGIRDAVIAVGALTSEGAMRRRWLMAGAVSDFSDAVSSLLAGRKGQMSPTGQALHSAPGIIGTSLGIAALLSERH